MIYILIITGIPVFLIYKRVEKLIEDRFKSGQCKFYSIVE